MSVDAIVGSVRLFKLFFLCNKRDGINQKSIKICQIVVGIFIELLPIYRKMSKYLPRKVSLLNPLPNWGLILMHHFYIDDCSSIEDPNWDLLLDSKSGNFIGVEYILKHCSGVDINTQDTSDSTPLIWASKNGHAEVVQLLLMEDGVDVNKASDLLTGTTPLIQASINGHAEVIRLLLKEEGININKADFSDETALYWASRRGNSEVVELLLKEEDIDINKANTNDESALYAASFYGHAEIVKQLIQKPEIEINRESNNTLCTALWAASESDHTEAVQLLLEHPKTNITKGVSADEDINAKIARLIFNEDFEDKTETVDIFVAALLENATEVSALLQNNITLLNSNDNLHRTLLFWASTRGHLQLAKNLLNNTRILVNRKRSTNEATALYQASKYGHFQIVDLILKHPAVDVNLPTLDRETPLMASTLNGHAEVAKKLLSVVNINVNYATFDGKTALIYAASAKSTDILELLLRCPQTDTSLMDEGYWTALDIATQEGHTEAVNLFASRGTLQMTKGHTCCSKSVNRGLHTAVRNADLKWMETFLVCPDIKINVHNKDGQTPLNLAVMRGVDNLVQLFLFDQRIDVNKPNTGGKQNALLIASEMGHTNILKLILRHNQTFVNQHNANKETALQMALKKYEKEGQRKYFRIIKLLLRCPKTELIDQTYNGTEIDQALELRALSMLFIPTCCLHVNESLLGSAWAGDFRAIRGLLQCPGSEWNVNMADNKGRTLLYIAAMMGHLEAVEVLLQNPDVDVNIGRRYNGGTAFSIASEKSHFDVMEALIIDEKSIKSKGWCSDQWTKRCKKIEEFAVVTVAPATKVPSGELSLI